MSTTAQDLYYDIRALFDELTDSGTLIPSSELADLESKSIRFIDMAQKVLYKDGNNFKKFTYTGTQTPNLMGNGAEWDVIDYEETEQYYPTETGIAGAKAYYFEVDGAATVTIEENQGGTWTALATETIPSTVTELTAYKGAISPVSADNPIRMKFGGSFHYHHKNRALYSVTYDTGKIPDYAPYFAVEVPSDFRSINQIIKEDCTGRYVNQGAYKWQGFRELYISYYFDGVITIVYRPVPTTITALTDTLEIDDITAKAIPYYAAAKIAPNENTDVVSYFEQLYSEALAAVKDDQKMPEQSIEDLYGGL